MDGLGEEFFARSTLSLYHDGGFTARDIREDTEDAEHCRMFADDVLEGVLLVDLLVQLFD